MLRRISGWLLALIAVYPLLYLAVLAVAGRWPAPRLWPESWRFDRLQAVLFDATGLGSSLLLSLWIAMVVAGLATALGFITSRHLAFARRPQMWLMLSYLPFAFSPLVLATCLLYFFLRLHLAGTVAGVIVAQIIITYGFATVLQLGIWNTEKRGLEEVARTLGGTPRQVFWHVLVPSALPLIRVCFLQTFLVSWVQYGLTLMIGGGKVRTLPLRVFNYAFEADPGYAALAGLLLMLPPLVLVWIERRAPLKVS